ncbi:hypothetical protein M6D81_22100 [Paenibacillus sp. J5C_2022]|uniref:hypothetical protein n=1 Tax=Paenibacillus sp. J5C2022 TaxID=2977129 RepID=UPI0021CEFE16|nr:hypothetical protein [Paenibacillus sp. J5C2022]MCU6711391.1 hypothetical protein [Paenibacillus sp. J5C2022]
MKIVNNHLQFPKASLKKCNDYGYIHVAAEIEKPIGPFPQSSERKRKVIRQSKEIANRLRQLPDVHNVHVFEAVVIPPGRGKLLEERKGKVHVAQFDVVVLIETNRKEATKQVQEQPLFKELLQLLTQNSKYMHKVAATNVRRIGDVDKSKQGVFLFNYFYADDVKELLPVWEYTAGWFTVKTDLDNSTLLLPNEGEQSQYGLINHCRWDNLSDIVPDLLFRPTFGKYVLENFEVNGIAAMPILYKLTSA